MLGGFGGWFYGGIPFYHWQVSMLAIIVLSLCLFGLLTVAFRWAKVTSWFIWSVGLSLATMLYLCLWSVIVAFFQIAGLILFAFVVLRVVYAAHKRKNKEEQEEREAKIRQPPAAE